MTGIKVADINFKECSFKGLGKGNKTRTVYFSVRAKLMEQRAKLPFRVHPHLLRHTFATVALNGGMNITGISKPADI